MSENIKEGIDITSLSLAGIFDLSNQLLAEHKVIKAVNKGIGDILNTELMLNNDAVKTQITVAGDGNTDEKKIYSLLEKLDLNIQKDSVSNYGNVGLGTSNLMSMACEMLLNQDNNELSTFMLIEEPEAHIHAQSTIEAYTVYAKERRKSTSNNDNAFSFIGISGRT
mgnify:CR=1 FL=1